MVWSEYAEEAYAPETYENEILVDDYEDYHPIQLNQEDWEEWYHRDLLNMWMSLMEYRSNTGMNSFLLTGSSFSDFCTFCYNFSHGYASPMPS